MNLDFVQNPWFTLSGWIIGAISLAAAFYYGVKGKAKKELSYLFVKSERLISNGEKKVPKLHLLFGDKEINDITITTCTVWNTGNQTINSTDLVDGYGLTIFPEENCRILDAQILAENNPCNRIDFENISEENVEIEFDYMDPKQGATLQIIHEGDFIYIDCQIKGGKLRSKEHSGVFMRENPFSRITIGRIMRIYLLFLTIVVGFPILKRLIVKLAQGDNLADVFALFSNLTISDIGVIALMFLLYGSFLFLTVTTTYSEKMLTVPRELRYPFKNNKNILNSNDTTSKVKH